LREHSPLLLWRGSDKTTQRSRSAYGDPHIRIGSAATASPRGIGRIARERNLLARLASP